MYCYYWLLLSGLCEPIVAEKITIIILDGVIFVISHPVTCVQPSEDDFITRIDGPFEREMEKNVQIRGVSGYGMGGKFGLIYIYLEVSRCCVIFSWGDQ